MSTKYFIALADNSISVRVAASTKQMYEQVAEALREEDVHGLAIPMSASRLAPGVWVQFQIPGVGTIVCWEEISAHTWDNGPTGEWRTKVILARYGAWGDEDAMDALKEGVRSEFGGDFPEWTSPSDEDEVPDWESDFE